jgi:hypothetical protein
MLSKVALWQHARGGSRVARVPAIIILKENYASVANCFLQYFHKQNAMFARLIGGRPDRTGSGTAWR